MADLDYIKAYLIKLGVDIDQTQLKQWDQSLNKLDSSFKKFSKNVENTDKKIGVSFRNKVLIWSKSLAKAGSILGAASLGIAKFLQSTANSDLEMQKFARSMYLSETRAKALKNTLGAMDLGFGDLRDVAYNPELLTQYKEFLSLAKSFKEPQGMKDSFREIRSIFKEFQKFNLTFTYFRERVAHFIYNVVRVPAQKFRSFLQGFNNRFSYNINNWAKKLGTFLGSILRIGIRLAEMVKGFGNILSQLWNRLSGFWKKFIAGFIIFNRVLKASPLGRFLALLTGVVALYDDFRTFREGGVSSKTLKPVWKFIGDQIDNPDSFLNKIINGIAKLIEIINNLGELIKSIWNKFSNSKLGQKLGLGNGEESLGVEKKGKIIFLENIGSKGSNSKIIEQSLAPWSSENRLNGILQKNVSFAPWSQEGQSLLRNQAQTPINQTFNFNLNSNSIENPESFVEEVGILLRNNKTLLVG